MIQYYLHMTISIFQSNWNLIIEVYVFQHFSTIERIPNYFNLVHYFNIIEIHKHLTPFEQQLFNPSNFKTVIFQMCRAWLNMLHLKSNIQNWAFGYRAHACGFVGVAFGHAYLICGVFWGLTEYVALEIWHSDLRGSDVWVHACGFVGVAFGHTYLICGVFWGLTEYVAFEI